MIDTAAIKARFEALAPFLGERERRLWAASEAHAAGRGGMLAVSAVSGVARSTIGRGLAELGHGKDQIPGRIRRPGGGRKPKTATEHGLLDIRYVTDWKVMQKQGEKRVATEKQHARFVETARVLGCDESEQAFDEKLKAVVKPKQKSGAARRKQRPEDSGL